MMRTLALISLVLLAGCDTWNSGKALVDRYDVVGTVQNTGSKPFTAGGETKFSVNLTQDDGTPKIVNCTSTQCGSLVAGQKVKLSCFEEVHVSEPNEEECRFDSLLPAS